MTLWILLMTIYAITSLITEDIRNRHYDRQANNRTRKNFRWTLAGFRFEPYMRRGKFQLIAFHVL